MIRSTPLIVLHTTKFGENSLVIHTLSRDYGRRSFLVRGVGNRASMSLFLPLTLLDADIIENSRSDLYTARNLSTRCSLLGIRNDIYKNSMTMFMSEVLYRVVKDGSAEHGMYEWCERNILLLDAMQTDFSNFHIRFLLELCVTLGFSPESCDLKPFAGTHYSVIERFMSCSFAESMLIPLNGVTRNEIAEEILRYIEFHTESTLNVNSLKVLRELYV